MHNTSRLHINDPDYPIGLPEGSSPSEEAVLFKDENPSEFGLSLKSSFNFGDITISALDLYDRIFNVSGFNIYANCEEGTDGFSEASKFSITPRYSYRHTTALNFGAEVPFLRPKNISTSLSTDIMFVNHALQKYSEKNIIFKYNYTFTHVSEYTP